MSLTDEDYELLAEEIPSPNDPFIRQFVSGSEALQSKESALRFDSAFRASLSPIARRAAAIVSRVREHENQTVWSPTAASGEAQPDAEKNETVHPGMPFHLAKPRIETTDLWRIVRKLPKGAALHSHMDGLADFDYVVGLLLETPGMHVSADGPVSSPASLASTPVRFRFRKQESSEVSIWTSGYVPGTWRSLSKAASEFPDQGRAGFVRWLTGQCVLSRDEAVLNRHHGPGAIWRSFERCFQMADSILHYEPIFRAFLGKFMRNLRDDGVSWIEIRITYALDFYRKGSETPEQDYHYLYSVVDEELTRFKSDPANSSFWGLRFIWTSSRALPTRDLIQDMDNCITTKLAFPHLIAGYDVCGQEDRGRRLRDLLPEFFWFRKQCAQEGVEIPFFLHAGETIHSGPGTADANLYDALLLGTRRLGHAFSLHRHPLLVDMVKEKRVLVECCPVSNEVLRLSGPVATHPLPALLARGVPAALGNDCPGMLGQGGASTSHDFWHAVQGWGGLGLEGLGALAENSVRWAAFEDETAAQWSAGIREASLGDGVKAQRLKEWATEWERFCLWVVMEFGEKYGEHEQDSAV
ncbi:hypothetical protein ACRALDRAFT_1047908 [Sodiomyces alcalophilus JCM 7366]|uniref:uncharacterized protein n=1 Tax=Sodiomyces alcalophilus JCM 7366 TaxID=591952 RepID=UPI0039B5E70D